MFPPPGGTSIRKGVPGSVPYKKTFWLPTWFVRLPWLSVLCCFLSYLMSSYFQMRMVALCWYANLPRWYPGHKGTEDYIISALHIWKRGGLSIDEDKTSHPLYLYAHQLHQIKTLSNGLNQHSDLRKASSLEFISFFFFQWGWSLSKLTNSSSLAFLFFLFLSMRSVAL